MSKLDNSFEINVINTAGVRGAHVITAGPNGSLGGSKSSLDPLKERERERESELISKINLSPTN